LSMKVPANGPQRPGTRPALRSAVLGSLTIQGHPSQVRLARAFVARTLDDNHAKVDSDAATLLTSEIVTNAIQHTKSGLAGGTVTIVVMGVPHGVLIEVIDAGSPDVPIVKGDLYAADGHGLFMVQQLAGQWGYLRDPGGTTVWFHLPAPGETDWLGDDTGPAAQLRRVRDAVHTERGIAPPGLTYRNEAGRGLSAPPDRWAAAI